MKKDLISKLDIDNMDTNELIKALKHQDSNIRARAAGALAYEVNEIAIEPLIEALRDKSDRVRGNAVWALGFISGEIGAKDTRVLKLIINALNDKSPDVREGAVLALKYLRNEENVKPLIKALGDKDSMVRCAAVNSLKEYGIMGYRGIVKPLTETLLNDENGDVRYEAARELDCLDIVEIEIAVEPLIRALNDKNLNVRSAVAHSLGELGHGLEDKRFVVPLIKALKDDEYEVREEAAWSLGQIRDKRAVNPLIQVLLKDEYSIVRISSINALRKIGDKRAIKPLLRVHKDDKNKDVKNAAEEALLWIFENGKYKSIFTFDKLKENDRVEFKSSLRWDIKKNCINKELQKSVAKTIAAFLNTKGGTLYIGVKDDCSINSIENDINSLKSKSIDDFEQFLIQVIVNYLGTDISDHIEIDFDKEEGKTICKVKIEKSKRPVYLKRKKGKYFYIRAGNTTRYLDIEEAVNYIHKNWRFVKGNT